MKRKAISKGTRFRVFARDGFKCRYCGAQSDTAILVVDHIIPVAAGGTGDDDNLITACRDCNAGKSAKLLDRIAPTEQDRLRIAQERNEMAAAAEEAKRAADAYLEFRQEVINLWCGIRDQDSVDRRTVEVIISYARKYGLTRVAEWVAKAHAKAPWAKDYKVGMYVSGIRRKMIEAGELTEDGDG